MNRPVHRHVHAPRGGSAPAPVPVPDPSLAIELRGLKARVSNLEKEVARLSDVVARLILRIKILEMRLSRGEGRGQGAG